MVNISYKYSLSAKIKYSKYTWFVSPIITDYIEIYMVYLQEFLLKSPVVFSPIESGRLDT